MPKGPVIQENVGERAAPSRTYQDLLKNAHDELLFEYYATSQVALVRLNGDVSPLGSPGLIYRADPSPDGSLCAGIDFSQTVFVSGAFVSFSDKGGDLGSGWARGARTRGFAIG